MTSLVFEKPQRALQDSYRAMIQDFVSHGEEPGPFPLSFPNEDFEAFLAKLDGCARGEGIPEGFVPHTTYWLVADGSVVGASNLRHSLTDRLRRVGGHIGYGVRPSARGRGYATELLRRTVHAARAMGLSDLLVTCNRDNTASARVIVKNGGVLDAEEFLPEAGITIQRYWIKAG